jgi:hypothetical protein
MTKFIGLVILVLLGFGSRSAGQVIDSVARVPVKEKKYYLVLDKPGNITRLRFYTGQQLNFRLTGERQNYSGVITDIKKDAIVLHYTEIPLNEIERITIPQRANTGRFLYGFGNGLRGVGSLFFLVGASNYVLKPQDRENGRITAQGGLGAFLAGQLFRGFNKRTYRLNHNRQLKTIEIM